MSSRSILHRHDRWPALRGAATALLAAALFGASTPLVQRFGIGLGPFVTAALLYAGAALFGAATTRRVGREARLQRADLGRLLAVAACGAVVGPTALAWGLQHTSAASASLMLTLEVVFTAVLAWGLYRESVDGRVGLAMALLTAGGALLVFDSSRGAAHAAGLLAVLLACAAWGLDNVLSRSLAERDPGQVVMAKAALGAAATAGLAFASGESLPRWPAALALLIVGATGYGLSLRCYLLAQRAFGATRTSSVFAFAPFVGVAAAIALGERVASPFLAGGAAAMLAGIALHLGERHRHAHAHEAMAHEHAHRHDDGHHDHDHAHAVMPAGAHSHLHQHLPLQHSHAHVPDAHHAHEH